MEVLAGYALFEGSKRVSFGCTSQLLSVSNNPWHSLACGRNCNSCLCPHMAYPCWVCLYPFPLFLWGHWLLDEGLIYYDFIFTWLHLQSSYLQIKLQFTYSMQTWIWGRTSSKRIFWKARMLLPSSPYWSD